MENHKDGFKPTCREVHRLTSEGMDRELSMVERTRMRLHLVVCEACTRFNLQMAVLRRAMRATPPPADLMPPEAIAPPDPPP